jgi:hypothetical protein
MERQPLCVAFRYGVGVATICVGGNFGDAVQITVTY